MLRLVLAMSLLCSPAFAQSVIDLSTPQTEGFRSVVDWRGNPNLKPHEGNPVEAKRSEPAAAPAGLQSAAVSSEGQAFAAPHHAMAPTSRPGLAVGVTVYNRTVHVDAHTRKDGTAVAAHTRAAPRIRLRRR